MPNPKDVLGFGKELDSVTLILRFMKQPARYLTEPIVGKEELVAVVALVWRSFLAVKLVEILPWFRQPHAAAMLIMVFLFAKQLAWIALTLSAPPVNWIIGKLGGKDDIMAAQRALAFTSIIPNPVICLYLLSPLLGKVAGPVVSTFVLYGVCGVVGTVLDWLTLAKAYRLSRGRSAILVAMPTALALIIFFQIPFYLSDRFSPPIVKGDADLTLLEFRRFPLDSSKDGSGFLKADLLDFTAVDTAEMDTIYERRMVPDERLGAWLGASYRNLSPLLAATYFDKRYLELNLPEYAPEPVFASMSPEYASRIYRYGKILVLYATYCMATLDHARAEDVLEESLQLTDAMGFSNLGLIASIQQSVLTRRLSDLIAANITKIEDPDLLKRYAGRLLRHAVDQECLLNSLRQEYLLQDAIIRKTADTVYAGWRRLSDSAGFHAPGYTWRKFLDTADSHEILSHIWAKTIQYSKHPDIRIPGMPHELIELQRGRRLAGLLVFKNILGRITLPMAVPLYHAYGQSVLNNRRHMETTHAALILRAGFLITGDVPPVSAPIPGLLYSASFSIRNDSLISKDSLRFKETFSLAIR